MTLKLYNGGFTLIEVQVSIVIIAMLAGISVPVYNTIIAKNDLSVTADGVASSIRRAQLYSKQGHSDSAWGVRVQPSVITLFKGSSYAARDSALDENITIPGTLSTSGLNEIVFEKLNSAPNVTGNIVLTAKTNDTRTISINVKGTVDY